MAKGKVLDTIVSISGEISPTLGKTIDGVVKQLGGVNTAALAAGAAVVGIGAAAVVGVAKAGKALAGLGDEYNSAVNSMSMATGAMGGELDDLAQQMQDVYAGGFGEDMQDVADAMSTATQITGAMGDELQGLTEDAITLRDTFRYDINESMRAADAMMTNFGISGDEAMNLIAAGAQNGLDFSGELIDTINEYSVQFAKVGFDAEQMFAVMQSGADGTAWNLDKVGDAVKEFSIRSIDGSATTVDAFNAIGLNADQMMQTFAAGGDAANAAFYDVLDALLAMEDPVARDAAGVGLFGTMWEDLGVEAVQALADTENALYDAGDALENIQEVKFDNLGDAFEMIKRQGEVALLPLASSLASLLVDIAPAIGDVLGRLGPLVEQVTASAMPLVEDFFGGLMDALDALGPVIDQVLPVLSDSIGMVFEAVSPLMPILTELIGNVLPVIAELIAALSPVIATVLSVLSPVLSSVSQLISRLLPPLSNLLQALAPILQQTGVLISSTVGAAFQALGPLISGVTSILGSLINFITSVFSGNWSAAWQGIKDIFSSVFNSLAGIVKAPINAVIAIVNGVISAINGIGFTIPDWVPLLGGKTFGLNIPEIPMLAAGGFTDGPSIAGEAGTEAVISFDPAYRAENLAYWAQAGQMLGARAADAAFALGGGSGGAGLDMSSAADGVYIESSALFADALDEGFSFTSGGDTSVYLDMGGVTFAPHIEIKGEADKRSVIDAIRDEYPEFLDMLEEWLAERGVTVYGY